MTKSLLLLNALLLAACTPGDFTATALDGIRCQGGDWDCTAARDRTLAARGYPGYAAGWVGNSGNTVQAPSHATMRLGGPASSSRTRNSIAWSTSRDQCTSPHLSTEAYFSLTSGALALAVRSRHP